MAGSWKTTAEATLRIYPWLAKVKNDHLDENEFVLFETRERSSSRLKGSNVSWFQSFQIVGLTTIGSRQRTTSVARGGSVNTYRLRSELSGEFRPELAAAVNPIAK